MFLPAAPPGGGFLVLLPAQISCWELVCAIKSNYPRTKIIPAQMTIPTK